MGTTDNGYNYSLPDKNSSENYIDGTDSYKTSEKPKSNTNVKLPYILISIFDRHHIEVKELEYDRIVLSINGNTISKHISYFNNLTNKNCTEEDLIMVSVFTKLVSNKEVNIINPVYYIRTENKLKINNVDIIRKFDNDNYLIKYKNNEMETIDFSKSFHYTYCKSNMLLNNTVAFKNFYQMLYAFISTINSMDYTPNLNIKLLYDSYK